MTETVANTDREIWRETEGDYYAPSIHVTEYGSIGINVGGYVHVLPVREWHKLSLRQEQPAGVVKGLVEVGTFIASSEHGVGVQWGDLGPLGAGDKLYALTAALSSHREGEPQP